MQAVYHVARMAREKAEKRYARMSGCGLTLIGNEVPRRNRAQKISETGKVIALTYVGVTTEEVTT